MIIQCKDNDINSIFNYIGEDYGKCLYIYIDLKKYSLNDKNFNIWLQYNENNEICALISEYYGGIQIYSKKLDFIVMEIAQFIKSKESNSIFGMKPILDELYEFLPYYHQETGYVGELTELKYPPNPNSYSASLDELDEIVKIIAEDEDIGKPYGYESLYNQYYKRKKENFGRNYILRDPENNEIIGHAGTYAELPELAVIGGVITAVPYRRKGFSKQVLSTLCHQLKSENKRIFSYFYVPSGIRLHHSIGFEDIGEWSKLQKID